MSQLKPCLQTEKIIPLPFTTESNAIAQEWRGDMWLLINQPGKQQTQLLNIKQDYEIKEIASLPIVASSLCSSKEHLIVTGANSDGNPLILALDANGNRVWEYIVKDIKPITWPVVAYRTELVLAWQQIPERIEMGFLNINSSKLKITSPIAVENPPARIISWKNLIWASWFEQGKIHITDLVENNKQIISCKDLNVGDYSVGQSGEGTYYGWIKGKKAYWLLPASQSPGSIILENDANGTFNLISGGEPLIWVQTSKPDIDKTLVWTSTLIIPGKDPFLVEDYVFTVAWWQQKVVLVKQSMVLLLQ